jgi:transcriptional regulator with XRE-family HTH domain
MEAIDFIRWRNAMGLTQKQAAQALGYKHRSTISQFENGYTEISERVSILCGVLKSVNDKKPKKGSLK